MGLENNALIKRYINLDEKTEGSTTVGILVGIFAAFGGVLFGYDTGTISGILAMKYVLKTFPEDEPGVNGEPGVFTSSEHSLIVSILSAGTFFGALGAPLINDTLGRRWTLIIATAVVFNFGIILQTATTGIPLLVAGRAFAGLGVGLVSAVIPMYQAECVPRWIRGAVTSLYQFAITIGLLLAACFNQATQGIDGPASYRIPIAIQFIWSIIITVGMLILPETPRFYILKGREQDAAKSLSRLRRLPTDHPAILEELAEVKANFEFESARGGGGWLDCFRSQNHQRKRVITGIWLQAFQQLTGINFVFYYGTTFFKNSGIKNEFLITIATNVVNVFMTLPGVVGIEVLGRRPLLLIGAAGMCISEFLIAIIGTAADSTSSNKATVAFTCIFIAFFASTWGPIAWVIIAETMPLAIRSKGVALSTASNWLWNFAIAYATPYLVDDAPGSARLKSKVFFIWGGCNFLCFFFAWAFVYETKGLTLEQVDELYDVVPHAWKSRGFVPTYHKFTRAVEEEPVHSDAEKQAIEHINTENSV
ncbi:CYFA0S22e01266g1_1 [Cyberlindnera fabianii]|uniref:CYFA0S22e01266g1_1 n=1 Tax=Cyberlindnera fabianii TaxID=36022 RepID=A0A061BA35_CYBFA|nr:CYFA0S22e01266g1_1 [Cyberlindnera fabianii]